MIQPLIKPRSVKIVIDDKQSLDLIEYWAKKNALGGTSEIYTTPEDRMKFLYPNQLCGETGNLALHILFFEKEYAIDLYLQSKYRNTNRGDGGYDIIDTPIDIKNSDTMLQPISDGDTPKMQYYNLIVQGKERRQNWVYISALSEIMTPDLKVVHIIGWARSSDLPTTPNPKFKSKAAFTIRHDQLREFPPPDVFPPHVKCKLKFNVFS